MPDDTTILSLPLILPAQAQKHVTHNEAIIQLDLIVQLAVINRTLTTAPALPSIGDRHIVATGATGPWVGQSGRIALFTAAGWQFTQPLPGWAAHVLAEGQTAVFDGLVWKSLSEGPLSVTRLGVSATADAANRLSVSAPATLLNHAGAGHQLKLNKSGAGNTASLLFQTGFGGRAEMGTAGSDDFSVKVSADGATWFSALEADASSGDVTLPQPVHLGGQAADPGAPADGTLWLNTTTGEVKVRSAGVTRALGSNAVSDGDKGDITVSGSGATWTIDAGTVTLGKLADIATDSFVGRDTAGTGSPEVLTPAQARGILNVADGATANASDAALRDRATHTGTQAAATITGLAAIATTGNASDLTTGTLSTGRLPAFGSGDVSFAASGGAGTIAANAVTNAKAADMVTARIKGRVTAGTGDPEDLTGTQATTLLDTFTSGLKGLAPASGGGTTNFLRADGTWAAAGGGGVSDGDKGDITVSGGGATWTIDNGVVALAKLADVATARLIGRSTAGTGVPEALTGTQATALLDAFTSGAKGLAPASGGGTANFLRADGTWAAPGGGGSGDVVGPGSAVDNALVRYDTTTGKLIQNSGVLLTDANEITLPNVTSPAAPAAGNTSFFALNRAGGISMPGFRSPSGKAVAFQASLADKVATWWFASGNGLTDSQFRTVASSTGTATAVNWASTNFRTRMKWREWLVTVAATTAVAGFRGGASQFTIGGGTDSGGFYFAMIWSPATGVTNASHRAFAGMLASTAAPTDVNPSTLLNLCGMGYDAADANIQFMHNDGAGTATKINLGGTLPKPSADRTKTYLIEMFSPPGSTQSLSYRVRDLETGAEATGTVTTDLPGTATALNQYAYISVGGVSSVVGIAISTVLTETDY